MKTVETAAGSPDTKYASADFGVATIPLGVALAAAGAEMRAALAQDGATAGWPSLVEAARRIAPLLGVDNALWAAACDRLGRYGAALALLVIERGAACGPDVGFAPIRRPAAYLRGMLGRADAGSLRLDRSVRAWAARGGG